MRRTIVACSLSLLLAGAASAQSTLYGNGSTGGGGFIPLHTANGPWLGNAGFRLQVDKGLGGAPAFFFVSISEANIPIVGGSILVGLTPPNPILLIAQTLSPGGPGQGSAFVALSLPQLPSLVGFSIFTQVLIPETPAHIVVSNGVEHQFTDTPEVFIGSSIAGSADPYQLIDATSFTIIDSGASGCTDNVSGAAFTHAGQELLVSSGFGTICRSTSTTPLSFANHFNASSSGCFGLHYDPRTDLTWTLTDPGTGTRELVALDDSGAVVHNTVNAFGGTNFVEFWTMAPSGRFAAVPILIPSSLVLISTDPQSPLFMQPIINLPLPPTTAIFSLLTDLRFTPAEDFIIATIQNAGAPTEVARFDMKTFNWWDHDPSTPGIIDHIGAFSNPPVNFLDSATAIDLSSNGKFAIISGIGNCGWMGRLDFDLTDRSFYSFNLWQSGGGLPNTWNLDLSPDDQVVATTSWNDGGCASITGQPTIFFLDSLSGATLGQITIPQNTNAAHQQNLYTIQYR